MLVKGFRRRLATDGIANEYRQKSDQVVSAEATSGKADPLGDDGKHSVLAKMMYQQGAAGTDREDAWMVTPDAMMLSMPVIYL